ncbi:MAG: PEP-CTERM sorting domain-containing protein [Smithellaceae bacterium]
MKKYLATIMVLCGLLIIVGNSWALPITPDTLPRWTGTNNDNMNASEIASYVGYNGTLSELYKQNVGEGSDSGNFAASYETSFYNTPDDPKDATITHVVGSAYITGLPLYLYVKDGNHDPAFYIFDITNVWNGTDTIYLTDFWPGRGAISHVTILGKVSAVPEPVTLILLGLGLLGVAGFRRKK